MTVYYTEFKRIGQADIATAQSEGAGAIQAAHTALANDTLADTETSAAFNGSTRLLKVHSTVDTWVAVGGASVDANSDPAIFIGAGTFDYIAVNPGQYLNVQDV